MVTAFSSSDGSLRISNRIAKNIGGQIYFGSITDYKYKTEDWCVQYDNYQQERYKWEELHDALELYDKVRDKDTEQPTMDEVIISYEPGSNLK